MTCESCMQKEVIQELNEGQDLDPPNDQLNSANPPAMNDDENDKKWEWQGPAARTFQGGYSLWSTQNTLVNKQTGKTVCPANQEIFAYEKTNGGVRSFGLVRGYWQTTEGTCRALKMIGVGRDTKQNLVVNGQTSRRGSSADRG